MRHLLHEVLVIAVCGLLVGGESFYDMEVFALEREPWLRGFLSLPGRVPQHDTFNRVFQAALTRAWQGVLCAGRKACASGCAAGPRPPGAKSSPWTTEEAEGTRETLI